MKSIILSVLIFISSISLYAQEFIWGVDFESKFNNKEFARMPVAASSETYFGSFLTPNIGLKFRDASAGTHKIVIGIDAARFFGNMDKVLDYTPILYYGFSSRHFGVNAGAFSPSKLLGDYNSAFFSDEVNFYDRSIEGALFQYKNKRGYSEVCVDWLSMRSENNDEIIGLYSASKYNFDYFYLGYHLSGCHYLWLGDNSAGVVEDFQLRPYIGVNFADYLPLDVLNLRIGWLQTFQKDRKNIGKLITPAGATFDLTLEKWNFGLNNSLYLGEALTPYYYNKPTPNLAHFGSNLYFGELFYNTDSGLYNKVELYWKKSFAKYGTAKLSCLLHLDGYGNTGWQQLASISINIPHRSIIRPHLVRGVH